MQEDHRRQAAGLEPDHSDCRCERRHEDKRGAGGGRCTRTRAHARERGRAQRVHCR